MSIVDALRSPEGLAQQLDWSPTPAQLTILQDKSRFQVFAGGRRVGKSHTGGHKLVPYAFSTLAEVPELRDSDRRREYWIVGPEYSDAEKEFRVVYNALKRLDVPFDRPGTYNNPHNADMSISLWDGLFLINTASAKYPDSLVGEGLSGVVLSEAAKLKPSTWPKYIRPMLSDFEGWALMSSTPEGRNWFYRAWQNGQDPLRPDWNSWRIPAWANANVYRNMKVFGKEADSAVKILQAMIKKRALPARFPLESAGILSRLFPGVDIDAAWEKAVDKTWEKVGLALGLDPEIVSLALDLSEELFNQEEAAEFNEFVGRVFKEFDEEVHVADFAYDPNWKTYAALDYGFTNPFVWLLIQVDPFGTNIRILDEYFEVGRTTDEAAREIVGRGLTPSSLLGMYPDPAEPDRSIELSKLLQVPHFGGTGGKLEDRLEWIRRKLRPAEAIAHLDPDNAEWVPQLQIHRRCKQTIREFRSYRYPRTADEAAEADREAPEAPLKKDDHSPEALGRFMVGHFGSPWAQNVGPTRVRRGKISRRR